MSTAKVSTHLSSILPIRQSSFRWADELDLPGDELLLRIRYEKPIHN
jgi:hypothetical protein